MNEPILSFKEWCKTIPNSVMERCQCMTLDSRNVFLRTLFAGYGIGYIEICALKAKLLKAEETIANLYET